MMQTLTMSQSEKKKINKRTKAIIVVHYAGNSCDMQKFVELKKKI